MNGTTLGGRRRRCRNQYAYSCEQSKSSFHGNSLSDTRQSIVGHVGRHGLRKSIAGCLTVNSLG
jgi:hypothetical protein